MNLAHRVRRLIIHRDLIGVRGCLCTRLKIIHVYVSRRNQGLNWQSEESRGFFQCVGLSQLIKFWERPGDSIPSAGLLEPGDRSFPVLVPPALLNLHPADSSHSDAKLRSLLGFRVTEALEKEQETEEGSQVTARHCDWMQWQEQLQVKGHRLEPGSGPDSGSLSAIVWYKETLFLISLSLSLVLSL